MDFFLVEGEAPREGDDMLPERSSEVTDRLALWELSDRSLKEEHGQHGKPTAETLKKKEITGRTGGNADM